MAACCYTTVPRASSRGYHNLSPFFPRSSPFGDFASSVQPFFRLLDEELTQASRTASRPMLRSFQPRFDVSEQGDAFHLQGELPGIDQQNINIEFKDENTLVVSGRAARENRTTDEDVKGKAKVTETGEAVPGTDATNDAASETGSSYHKPTVEDEFVDVAASEESQAAVTPATSATEVAQAAEEASAKQEQPQSHYWVNERSVGEFHRSFTFPGHINQEAVTASLKNGILNVVVPKAAQKEPKKITIQ